MGDAGGELAGSGTFIGCRNGAGKTCWRFLWGADGIAASTGCCTEVPLVVGSSFGGGIGMRFLGFVSTSEVFPLLASVSAEGGTGAF